MFRQWRVLLIQVLMAPLLPCFMWGPFTHPDIARRAFEKAKEGEKPVGCQEVVQCISRNKETYIYAANSPDAISTNHILRNVITYDYAHNNIPDEPDGHPAFGYRLLDKALERLKASGNPRARDRHEKEVAFACGWLSHQLADWIPHYHEQPGQGECRFTGYANSHQVLKPCFYKDILETKEKVEHGILELFHDAYVYARDQSGYLAPGKNTVCLLTDDRDNLITAVSEEFKSDGFSRLPMEHLPSLERDFRIVIAGMETLLILLSRLQPRFNDIVTAFIEEKDKDRNQEERFQFVDRSVDCVFSRLFALTRDEISEKASESLRANSYGSQVTIVQKKESILHQWAFKIGQAIKPQDIASILGERALIRVDVSKRLPEWIRGMVGQIEASTDIVMRLKGLLISRSKQIVDRSESTRALGRFLTALLAGGNNALEEAQDQYCEGLRPIAQLHVPLKELRTRTIDDIAREMVGKQVIGIRFTPALRRDKQTTKYLLDPDTVNIRVNGYSSEEAPDLFTVVPVDVESDVLKYEIHLKNIPRPVLHIFADVHDYRGEHSQYIDYQLKLS